MRIPLPRRNTESKPRSCQIGEHGCQQRRIIERFGAPQAHAFLFSKGLEADVDVVEDLDVIAQEPDGLNEYSTMTFLFQQCDGVLDSWSEPSSARHALALECEGP